MGWDGAILFFIVFGRESPGVGSSSRRNILPISGMLRVSAPNCSAWRNDRTTKGERCSAGRACRRCVHSSLAGQVCRHACRQARQRPSSAAAHAAELLIFCDGLKLEKQIRSTGSRFCVCVLGRCKSINRLVDWF